MHASVRRAKVHPHLLEDGLERVKNGVLVPDLALIEVEQTDKA